jgi:hypothetical protein
MIISWEKSQLNAYTEKGRIKPYYDGVLGLSPYIETDGEIYNNLDKAYQEKREKLTVSSIE